jgi:glutathione S-transferase
VSFRLFLSGHARRQSQPRTDRRSAAEDGAAVCAARPHLAETGYLAAGAFTLADMYLMPMLYYLSKVPEGSALLGKSTHLKTYFDRHFTRASLQQTEPTPLPQHAHILARGRPASLS